tara:strand:+ start:1825 stop:2238 length:414 start_codon:yes stop_codon:yes gene_type:complete
VGVNDHIFHCRTCGKSLYGAPAAQEVERQHDEWQKGAAARKRQEMEIARRAEAEAEKRRQEAAETARFVAALAQKKAKEERKRKEEAANNNSYCGWVTCDKGPKNTRALSRPNSKYCSRDCSNRNARDRHKRRTRAA